MSVNPLLRLMSLKPMQAIRKGLVMTIPVLTLGAVALILINMPIAAYQTFIKSYANGLLYRIFTVTHEATFGYLSVYMTISITVSYAHTLSVHGKPLFILSIVLTSLTVFAILSGVLSDTSGTVQPTHTQVDISALGVKGMFCALVSAITVTPLYVYLSKLNLLRMQLHADGSDASFTNAVSGMPAFFICVGSAALLIQLLTLTFHVSSLHDLFIHLVSGLFSHAAPTLPSALLYVFSSSVMWLMGIHGSDMLEYVGESVFNTWQAVDGCILVNKTFVDVFVLMGGCGTSMCLLLALVFFSKRRNSHDLVKLALFPACFNVNEILLFGMPVVLNPLLFIPFLATPILSMLTTTLAMKLGLVPQVCQSVVFTTPVLLSGYIATGNSLAGSVIQLVNISIGVLIYRPFILADEQVKLDNASSKLGRMIALCKQADDDCEPLYLLNRSDGIGEAARMLVSDLQEAIEEHTLMLQYQPHHDVQRRCVGAEGLLRWRHPTLGLIYPPLIIHLAYEAHLLPKLEDEVIDIVLRDIIRFQPFMNEHFHIAFNVTPHTLRSPHFVEHLAEKIAQAGIAPRQLMLEVTEQMAMRWDDHTETLLASLHDLGILLAIDDFSMGHTSIEYMKTTYFDIIKLDGSLVRDLDNGRRSEDIVSSLIVLSRTLHFQVVAEYVETEAQFKRLNTLGCQMYQGYLFSPALAPEAFEAYLTKHMSALPEQTAHR